VSGTSVGVLVNVGGGVSVGEGVSVGRSMAVGIGTGVDCPQAEASEKKNKIRMDLSFAIHISHNEEIIGKDKGVIDPFAIPSSKPFNYLIFSQIGVVTLILIYCDIRYITL
jgi:hypothetical protein